MTPPLPADPPAEPVPSSSVDAQSVTCAATESDRLPPVAAIAWPVSYRIVSSRFPPTGLFDRVARPEDLDAVYALEATTNPRLRQERDAISLVPKARRVVGPGTTPVMSAFAHPNPDGSRFAPPGVGVYYAAHERETAIEETVFHRERFLAYTAEPACTVEMRCYVARLAGDLHDLRGGYVAVHDPVSYAVSQALSTRLRDAGSNGMVYDSVRRPGGTCAAAFYPDLVGPCTQQAHLFYDWDGARISRVVVADLVYLR